MIDHLDAERCTFVFSTTVTIFDKMFFKKWIDVVENQMMDDAITEVSSEDFSFDWLINHETNALIYFISPLPNAIAKLEQVFFIFNLKAQLIDNRPLVFARVIVGLEQILEQLVFVLVHFFLETITASRKVLTKLTAIVFCSQFLRHRTDQAFALLLLLRLTVALPEFKFRLHALVASFCVEDQS